MTSGIGRIRGIGSGHEEQSLHCSASLRSVASGIGVIGFLRADRAGCHLSYDSYDSYAGGLVRDMCNLTMEGVPRAQGPLQLGSPSAWAGDRTCRPLPNAHPADLDWPVRRRCVCALASPGNRRTRGGERRACGGNLNRRKCRGGAISGRMACIAIHPEARGHQNTGSQGRLIEPGHPISCIARTLAGYLTRAVFIPEDGKSCYRGTGGTGGTAGSFAEFWWYWQVGQVGPVRRIPADRQFFMAVPPVPPVSTAWFHQILWSTTGTPGPTTETGPAQKPSATPIRSLRRRCNVQELPAFKSR